MRRHMNISKPFRCDICGAYFSRKATRRIHYAIHMNTLDKQERTGNLNSSSKLNDLPIETISVQSTENKPIEKSIVIPIQKPLEKQSGPCIDPFTPNQQLIQICEKSEKICEKICQNSEKICASVHEIMRERRLSEQTNSVKNLQFSFSLQKKFTQCQEYLNNCLYFHNSVVQDTNIINMFVSLIKSFNCSLDNQLMDIIVNFMNNQSNMAMVLQNMTEFLNVII